ncbi:MAG: sigma-70 family RNA polymerase sigma factor [Alicyclobacillus sp.]|nr:sigma-70 family RNA polymerase sigma factor [Alicyclobacillus sp.]
MALAISEFISVFARMTDEELACLSQEGNQEAFEALLFRFSPFIRWKASCYYAKGATADDLFQEGCLGLYEAVVAYQKGRPFKPFATMCITREILQTVKLAGNQKHSPLNTAISLDTPIKRGEEYSCLAEILPDKRTVIPDEHVLSIQTLLSSTQDGRTLKLRERSRHNIRLTPFERDVLLRHIAGYSYEEMSRDLQRDTKAIDNAVQRARSKISSWLQINFTRRAKRRADTCRRN